ncbi:MAG: CDP-alcohol phosphatidyltransferase family protein [Methanomassiliicoccales archaeon]
MVLNRERSRFEMLLSPLARLFARTKPDTLTWLAIIFSAACAFAVFFSTTGRLYLLEIAAVLLALSGLMDALDGVVARNTGRTSKKGDFLDHVLDRYADIFLVIGINFSSLTTLKFLGIFALTGILMTSYLGTQSQALGLKRNYGGPLGRADRLVLMLIAFLIQIGIVLGMHTTGKLFGLTTFDYLLIVFAVVGHITAVYRAAASWRLLSP